MSTSAASGGAPKGGFGGRQLAIATLAAGAFGYYMMTRSRARNAKLIQPEEQEKFQGSGQTYEGGAHPGRGVDIARSGGGGSGKSGG